MKKIYSAKKDGDSFDNFMNKCEGKTKTIIVVKSKKGFRFGGF